MANLSGFNAAEVQPNSFEPIPNGVYNAIITESNWKQTQSGAGRYLEFKFQIIDGEYKNKVVFARLNLENPNMQTVEIARGTLSAICRAVEVLQPNDSCELHNLPLSISVSCVKNKLTGEIYNDIKNFKKKGEGTSIATAQASDDTPPWKKQ